MCAALCEMDKLIELKNISKEYDGEKVLDDISMVIHDKEFVTLLGPSGCGKTTTLRIIGGFAEPDAGDLYFNGERVNDLPAYKRPVNTVFQRYALFPHLNVYENIAFALRLKKLPEKEVKERVGEMLKMVHLEGFQKRKVTLLSGGQQQRVAIARALINMPQILFADEPTGNLDRKNADEVLELLLHTRRTIGQTLVMVTHDMKIAKRADRVLIMENGNLLSRNIDFDGV